MSTPRVATGFGHTPFDRIVSFYTVTLKDTFVTTETTTAAGEVLSELRWIVTDEAGDADGDVTQIASEDNHQGIIQLAVGGTSPADGDLVSMSLGASDDNIKLDSNSLYMAAVLRVPDVSDTIVQFGLVADPSAAPNSGDDDLVAFVFDPEDADNTDDELWFAQVNDDSGGDTEVIFDKVPYVQDDWVLLELSAADDGATFRLTTEDNTQTERIPVGVDATLTPVFQVENVGNAEELIEIDTFVMRYTLPDGIVNYLGA